VLNRAGVALATVQPLAACGAACCRLLLAAGGLSSNLGARAGQDWKSKARRRKSVYLSARRVYLSLKKRQHLGGQEAMISLCRRKTALGHVSPGGSVPSISISFGLPLSASLLFPPYMTCTPLAVWAK
jgi:hypothetical protein